MELLPLLPLNTEALAALLRYGRKCSGPWDESHKDGSFLPDDSDIDDLVEAWDLLREKRGVDCFAEDFTMPRTAPKRQRLFLSLTEETAEKLRDLSEADSRSPSQYVEHLLRQHFKQAASPELPKF